jgi:hypothetical protein
MQRWTIVRVAIVCVALFFNWNVMVLTVRKHTWRTQVIKLVNRSYGMSQSWNRTGFSHPVRSGRNPAGSFFTSNRQKSGRFFFDGKLTKIRRKSGKNLAKIRPVHFLCQIRKNSVSSGRMNPQKSDFAR